MSGRQSYQVFCDQVRACRLCRGRYFEHDPRPVFQAEQSAKVLVVGQAPSRRVHETGLPWNDVSGDNLRSWMGVAREQFYNPAVFAIVPMGLCYPGTVPRKGDLPPPPICAPQWHQRFLEYLQPEVTLLIGRYAQTHYLGTGGSVASVVAGWRDYLRKGLFPLPHPSPRNRKWISDRPWFAEECPPALMEVMQRYLD